MSKLILMAKARERPKKKEENIKVTVVPVGNVDGIKQCYKLIADQIIKEGKLPPHGELKQSGGDK